MIAIRQKGCACRSERHGLRCSLRGAALAGALFCSLAAAQSWRLASPDSAVAIDIRNDSLSPISSGVKALYFRAGIGGTPFFDWSPAGLQLTEPWFAGELTFAKESASVVDETYLMVSGKRLRHHNLCNELQLTFAATSSVNLTVVFRAYNDGIAYRYRLEGAGGAAVSEELSGFSVPESSAVWMQKITKNYEGIFNRFTAGGSLDTGSYGNFPLLVHTPDSVWVLLTEAALYGTYGACHFSVDSSDRALYRITLPQGVIAGELPWDTPWRVAVVGKSLGTVVESNLVDNLNPPCELTDVSWIRPGRVAWSWWSQNGSPDSLNIQKQYVDFAQQMGWEYVLVDNGWQSAWVSDLVQYASARNVGILLWYNWTQVAAPAQRSAVLSQLAAWGVKGLKVDFFDSDDQDRIQVYDALAAEAAAQHLVVNFHGTTVYRGQSRRWPNFLTDEAVRGAEHYKDKTVNGVPPVFPSPVQNCTLPFTRNAVGPMDYTPVTFSTPNRTTTDGHELALSVVFESGLQHFADNPVVYTASAGKPFLAAVPVVWNDTKFLDGYPGEYCCLARRRGTTWWVAGINAGAARTLALPLTFLKSGSYTVDMYNDSTASGGLKVYSTAVSSASPLSVSMAPNGGFCFAVPASFDTTNDSLAIRTSLAAAKGQQRLSITVEGMAGRGGIRIVANNDCTIRIVDLRGRTIVRTQGNKGVPVVLPAQSLGLGVHVLCADDGSGRLVRTVVRR